MLQSFGQFATDYPQQLRNLKSPESLRDNEFVVQFPFVIPVVEEKSEEELARIAEKRKEQGRKLQELAAKTRLEKVQEPSLSPITVIYIKQIARPKGNRPPVSLESKGWARPGREERVDSMLFQILHLFYHIVGL